MNKFLSWQKQTEKKSENESFQKKHLRNKKELYYPFERHEHCESNEVKKKEEHVPRHIELTAVLRDLKTKNKVIE
jgi:hypothetical protein